MEAKASAFVDAFSATLFAQWAPHRRGQRFWEDDAQLRRVLEDGVAKLPKGALKGLLSRDLARFVAQLRKQLERQHANAPTPAPTRSTPLLLSEEDVERALATTDDANDANDANANAHIRSVLALEDVASVQTAVRSAATAAELVAAAEQCVLRLRTVRGRRFDADADDRTAAAYETQLHASVAAAARLWVDAGRGCWHVAAATAAARERETLRTLLQAVVAADLVRSAAGHSPARPWTAFFRPQNRSAARADGARAGVYGALLSLAVSFPVVYDDDDSDDQSTSEDSSSDDDATTTTNASAASKSKREDCVTLAARVVRQIAMAARRHDDETTASEFLLAVLAVFHAMPTPSAFVNDDDDDDDEDGLSASQQRGLRDALAELYARTFANAAALWRADSLLETLLCLRHAAEFMRVERKQSVPAVAAATAQLVGVALPPAFWRWMLHVKKVFAGEHAVVQSVMKKLSKNKSDKKMANVLMHDSLLTLSEMRVLVEQYKLFLEAEKERAHFVVARAPKAADQEPQDDGEPVADQALFFTDNDGGDKNSTKKKKKKRSHSNSNSIATETETLTETHTETEVRKRGRTTDERE